MRFAVTCVFAAAVLWGAPPTPSGRWEGFATIPGRDLALVIDLAADDAGKWTGSSIFPGMDIKGAPLTAIKVAGPDIAFAIPTAFGGVTLQCRLSAEGRMTGDLEQAGNRARVVLTRTGPPQVELPLRSTAVRKDLEGEWKGDYDLMDYAHHVSLAMTNQPDGSAKAKLVITGKKVNDIPVDLISQEGDFLSVESHSMQITVQVRFRRDAGELRGTFQQGPFEVPLVLRRVSK